MDKPNIDNYFEFRQHVLDCYPKEACGFVINNLFVPADNCAENPEKDFRISAEQYLAASKLGIQAILHSHPYKLGESNAEFDPCTPSMSDLQGQQDTNVPWGIVATEGEGITEPVWFGMDPPPPLEGRQFLHNVYDCYTLVRDYYNLNHGLKLKVYPRPANWQDYDQNIYENHYRDEGFLPVEGEPKAGDAIFFKVMTRSYVDHAGIYLGDDTFIHHQHNRLSTKERLSKWKKHIAYFVRHKDL